MDLLPPDPDPIGTLDRLGGPALVRRVLTALETHLRERPTLAEAALAARDAARLADAVHPLLSVAGYAGEHNLRAAAQQVETAAHAEDWTALATLVPAFAGTAAALQPRVAARLAALPAD